MEPSLGSHRRNGESAGTEGRFEEAQISCSTRAQGTDVPPHDGNTRFENVRIDGTMGRADRLEVCR